MLLLLISENTAHANSVQKYQPIADDMECEK
jgi:hypothetical protein